MNLANAASLVNAPAKQLRVTAVAELHLVAVAPAAFVVIAARRAASNVQEFVIRDQGFDEHSARTRSQQTVCSRRTARSQ